MCGRANREEESQHQEGRAKGHTGSSALFWAAASRTRSTAGRRAPSRTGRSVLGTTGPTRARGFHDSSPDCRPRPPRLGSSMSAWKNGPSFQTLFVVANWSLCSFLVPAFRRRKRPATGRCSRRPGGPVRPQPKRSERVDKQMMESSNPIQFST